MTKSHGNRGKIVHRPCSSCISSRGNLTGTLSSSPCQLRLEVVLRCLSLSSYNGHRNRKGGYTQRHNSKSTPRQWCNRDVYGLKDGSKIWI